MLNRDTIVETLVAFVSAFTLALALICLSGCAVPLLTGLKEIETSSGSKYRFITGADFHIGTNGIDRVDDNRGIAPSATSVKR